MFSAFRKYCLPLVFVSVIIVMASCTQGPPVPFPAIDFSVEDIFTGEEIHLEDLKGRPVLIYFFASW